MRECFSSYTIVLIIDDEKAETLRLAIIQSCIELRPLDGPFAVFRNDLAPGFKALLMIKILSLTGSQLSSDTLRMPAKTLSQNVQSKKSGNIYWQLTPLQERYPSAVIVCCCIRQQFDSTRGFVSKEDAYSKRLVYKSTIADIGSGAETPDFQCQTRQQNEI